MPTWLRCLAAALWLAGSALADEFGDRPDYARPAFAASDDEPAPFPGPRTATPLVAAGQRGLSPQLHSEPAAPEPAESLALSTPRHSGASPARETEVRRAAAQQPVGEPARLALRKPAAGPKLAPRAAGGREPLDRLSAQLSSPATVLGSLGVVVGLFLLMAWMVRRGMPKQAGAVPREAVEVLGRVPLAGKLQMHLIRCGNKIVLVSATPTGIEALTEISDPEEVDRVAGLCAQLSPHSATAAFRAALGQYASGRPERDGLALARLGREGR